MNQKDAFNLGKRAGYNAAIYTEVSEADKNEHANCDCDIDEECDECLTVAAYESERNARDYSPFEHYAHEINTGRNPEGQWEAYDKGVEAGIKAGIKKRLGKVSA